MEPIVLLGGGGHCKSCIDVIEQSKLYKIVGILDMAEKLGQRILNYPIIGTDEEIEKFVSECPNFLITVGQIENPSARIKIYEKVKKAGGILPVIISKGAYVSSHAKVSEGSIIMNGAIINAGAKVGKACIINTKALIEHETEIGDFCHISTAANINGQVKVGNQSFIGSTTVVANNLNLCHKVTIGAGSQVLRDINLPGVYLGHPLRKIR